MQTINLKIGVPKIKTKKMKLNWYHRDSVDYNYYKMPGSHELSLDNYKKFTVEEVKHLAIGAFKTNMNLSYFENSDFSIGFRDGAKVETFDVGTKDGNSIWAYANKNFERSKRIVFCLLTSALPLGLNVDKQYSSCLGVYPSCL